MLKARERERPRPEELKVEASERLRAEVELAVEGQHLRPQREQKT